MQDCVSEFTFEFKFGSFDVHKFGEDLVFRLDLLVRSGILWLRSTILNLHFGGQARNLGFRNIVFNLQLGRLGLSCCWIIRRDFYILLRDFSLLFKVVLKKIRVGVWISTIVIFTSLAWRFRLKPKWAADSGGVCGGRPSTQNRVWDRSLVNPCLHSLRRYHRRSRKSQKGLGFWVLDLLSLIRGVAWARVGVCLKALLVVPLHVGVLVVGIQCCIAAVKLIHSVCVVVGVFKVNFSFFVESSLRFFQVPVLIFPETFFPACF